MLLPSSLAMLWVLMSDLVLKWRAVHKKKGANIFIPMLRAQKNNESVEAKDMARGDGPFFCLGCSARVVLKKGTIKTHHFAHLADRGCRHGQSEGEMHRRLKEEICLVLSSYPQVSDLQQERREIQPAYPDVSCRWGPTQRVAIEIQVSPISIGTIGRRIQVYTEQGIAVLWVLPWNEALVEDGRYRPTRWERYLHGIYRGKLFYWSPDQELQPVSYRALATTGDAFVWHENEDEWIFAGWPRTSKIYKQVHVHPPVTFSDLVAVTYPSWEGERISLPRARLWTLRPEPSAVSKRRPFV
jgi:competence protein CoiA